MGAMEFSLLEVILHSVFWFMIAIVAGIAILPKDEIARRIWEEDSEKTFARYSPTKDAVDGWKRFYGGVARHSVVIYLIIIVVQLL